MADNRILCAQTDPELFFPEKNTGRGSGKEAKAICQRCEVRLECLEGALERRERYGVWGGLGIEQRRAILRKRAVR
jgi:WhiB family transcriptional regulator, redox-sensing transcriptional regulator